MRRVFAFWPALSREGGARNRQEALLMKTAIVSTARAATADVGRIRIGGALRPMPVPPLATVDAGRIKLGGAVRRA